MQRHITLV